MSRVYGTLDLIIEHKIILTFYNCVATYVKFEENKMYYKTKKKRVYAHDSFLYKDNTDQGHRQTNILKTDDKQLIY